MNMDDRRIGILGAGGQADELESFLDKNTHAAFRAVTSEYVKEGLADIENPGDLKDLPVISAAGSPRLRKSLVEKWPGRDFVTVIAGDSSVADSVTIGEGCLVAPGAVVTTSVNIGEHSIINVGATVSHDCRLGAYTTVSPGAHVAGRVQLGDGVFVGIGAVIKNGLKIAPGVVIGAGAVVLKDITEENAVYAGVPAEKIGQNEGWLEEV